MQLGMIGLGRMGANMVRRLLKEGHEAIVFDMSSKAVQTALGYAVRVRRASGKTGQMRANSRLFMKKQYELYVRRFQHGEVSLEQVTLLVADDSGKFRGKVLRSSGDQRISPQNRASLNND